MLKTVSVEAFDCVITIIYLITTLFDTLITEKHLCCYFVLPTVWLFQNISNLICQFQLYRVRLNSTFTSVKAVPKDNLLGATVSGFLSLENIFQTVQTPNYSYN